MRVSRALNQISEESEDLERREKIKKVRRAKTRRDSSLTYLQFPFVISAKPHHCNSRFGFSRTVVNGDVFMMGSHPWNSHTIPPDLSAELFPGLSYEEAVEDQESLYEALKIIASDPTAMASNSQNNGQDQNSPSWDESHLSGNVDTDLQLALDEAVARSLQALEDEVDEMSISGTRVHNATENEGDSSGNISANASVNASASASASSSALGQNDDEALPEMTYEELLSLGEAIGTECKGLSQSDLNSLPTFKFKSRFLIKKSKSGDCPICISEYRHNQYLTTLPCAHRYHTKCINRWLSENKNCPICQMEVNLSS
ncbi:hypothetical protein V2J09_014555 [Rumex salicifolius]